MGRKCSRVYRLQYNPLKKALDSFRDEQKRGETIFNMKLESSFAKEFSYTRSMSIIQGDDEPKCQDFEL